jgi:hypothetical protein
MGYTKAPRATLWFCEGGGSGTPFCFMAVGEERARAIIAHHRLNVVNLRTVPSNTPTTDRTWIPPPEEAQAARSSSSSCSPDSGPPGATFTGRRRRC